MNDEPIYSKAPSSFKINKARGSNDSKLTKNTNEYDLTKDRHLEDYLIRRGIKKS